MTCAMCGSDFTFDERIYLDGESLLVCPTCKRRFEAMHEQAGRFSIVKCPTCRQVERVAFPPYKKKGRPPGSRNHSKLGGRDTHVPALETFTEGAT